MRTPEAVRSPLISVITVVYNGELFLEQTLLSVINQTYQPLEYILIDGGSTDRSPEIIAKHQSRIDYWISEPDGGIADAMNKGIKQANGDYLIFIHADDYLCENQCIDNASRYLDDQHDLFLFGIYFGKHLKPVFPRGFNPWMYFKTGVLHQGAITSRRVFEQIGLFDTEYRIVMDYEFFLRAYKFGIRAKKCPEYLSVMRDVGISSRTEWKDLSERFTEEYKAHKQHHRFSLIREMYWFMYWNYRRIKNSLLSSNKEGT